LFWIVALLAPDIAEVPDLLLEQDDDFKNRGVEFVRMFGNGAKLIRQDGPAGLFTMLISIFGLVGLLFGFLLAPFIYADVLNTFGI